MTSRHVYIHAVRLHRASTVFSRPHLSGQVYVFDPWMKFMAVLSSWVTHHHCSCWEWCLVTGVSSWYPWLASQVSSAGCQEPALRHWWWCVCEGGGGGGGRVKNTHNCRLGVSVRAGHRGRQALVLNGHFLAKITSCRLQSRLYLLLG